MVMAKHMSLSLPFVLGAAVWGQGCTSSSVAQEQHLVAHVDIPKFMGNWYVIGSIPTSFEEGAVNAIEAYTWNADRERIDVNFTYNQDKPDGEKKAIPQKAWVYNKETGSEWRVQPFWPLKFGYYILELADDYTYTVIGVPNKKWAWIMAREPRMEEIVYQRLADTLRTRGYDMSKLKKVPQVW